MKTNRLTPKKIKQVITPYSCMCNTIDCILKDQKTYDEYSIKIRNEYKIYEIIESLDIEPNPNEYRTASVIHIRTNEDPLNITKCRMAKAYLQMLIQLEDTLKKNNGFAKTNDIHMKPLIKLSETNAKLETLSFRYCKELLEEQEKNTRLETDNNDRKIREKSLRREIKELKHMMSQMTFPTSNETNEDDSSGDEPIEAEPIEEEPEPITPTTPMINVIHTYERVKNYMIRNACSIAHIAKRMNYKQSNILKVCDSFIKLKLLRNDEAHPKTNDIIDDFEFLTLLENV